MCIRDRFGGLANRLEAPNAWPAVSNAGNPIRTWVYFDRQGLPASFMGTSDDDANVHHWAWGLTMGAVSYTHLTLPTSDLV